MATKTLVVMFREVMDRHAPPEIFTCSAAEANEIAELLVTVECEGLGPIERVPYTHFIEKVPSITLEELYERFAEEFEEPEIEPSKEAAEKAAGGTGGGEEEKEI